MILGISWNRRFKKRNRAILIFQMILGMLLLILDGTFHTVNRTALRRLMTQPEFEVPAEWIPHMPLFTNAIDWAMDSLPAEAA